MSDDAPLITASSNEELRLRNEEKKRALKAVKATLVERYDDIRTLAPLVEEGGSCCDAMLMRCLTWCADHQRARALTSRATTLAAQILDARLALTRLRQAHPHPRLTIASATSALDEQVTQMQEKEDELQRLNNRIGEAKERVKADVGELEQLRSVEKERLAELKLVGRVAGEEEDPRLGELYDWYGMLGRSFWLISNPCCTRVGSCPRWRSIAPCFLSTLHTWSPKTSYDWHTRLICSRAIRQMT